MLAYVKEYGVGIICSPDGAEKSIYMLNDFSRRKKMPTLANFTLTNLGNLWRDFCVFPCEQR